MANGGFEISLEPGNREAAARLLYAAFSRKLDAFVFGPGGADRAVAVLEAGIDFARGLYALRGGEPIGVLGLELDRSPFAAYRLADLRRGFGLAGALRRLPAARVFDLFRHRPAPGEAYVAQVAVGEGARGLGVGSALLEAAFAKAREAGKAIISLDVVDTNEGARRLYERLGFKVVKEWRFGFLTRAAGFAGVRHMEKAL